MEKIVYVKVCHCCRVELTEASKNVKVINGKKYLMCKKCLSKPVQFVCKRCDSKTKKHMCNWACHRYGCCGEVCGECCNNYEDSIVYQRDYGHLNHLI